MTNSAPDTPHTIANSTSGHTAPNKNQQAISNTALILAAAISFAAALAHNWL